MDRARYRMIPLRGRRMLGDELIDDTLNNVQDYVPLCINKQRDQASARIQMPKQTVYLFDVEDPIDRQENMLFLISIANDTDIPLSMESAMTINANLFLMAIQRRSSRYLE